VRIASGIASFLMTRSAALVMATLFSSGLGGCAGQKVRAPYGEPPTWSALERGTSPRIEALLLDDAKIRRKGVGANLLVLAQRPSRFAATIQIAGQELVSVAAHEGGYTLRWSGDEGLAPGFYEGRDPSCAIETLLGVDLAADDLVTILLGGAPLVGEVESSGSGSDPRALQIRKQAWDRAAPGHEIVELVGNGYVQRLRFRWLGNAWVFAGTTIWRLEASTARGKREDSHRRWLVSIEHEAFTIVEGVALPSRIVVAAPGTRGKREELAIVVRHADVDPEVLRAGGSGAGDDGWDDDGWDEDTGSADPAVGADGSPQARPETTDIAADPREAIRAEGEGDEASVLPRAFRLEPGGSRARGDACRR